MLTNRMQENILFKFLNLSASDDLAKLKTTAVALLCIIIPLQLGFNISPIFPEENRKTISALLSLLLFRTLVLVTFTAILNELKIKKKINDDKLEKIKECNSTLIVDSNIKKTHIEDSNSIYLSKIQFATLFINSFDAVFIFTISIISLVKTGYSLPFGYYWNTVIIIGIAIVFIAALNKVSAKKEIEALSQKKKKHSQKAWWFNRT